MGALDRFLQMQQQGMDESQIARAMQEEGFSMKDINDSINQAKIKNAVSQEPEQQYQESQQSYQETTQMPTQEYSQQSYPSPDQQYQEYSPQQYQQGYYPEQGATSSETITDIAEQVVSEKIQEVNKKVENLSQNKTIMQRELEDLRDRLKRIEESLDNLQKAVIGKVGEFGESTKIVQRDLENIHNTMSKMMNPLMDNYAELRKINLAKSTFSKK